MNLEMRARILHGFDCEKCKFCVTRFGEPVGCTGDCSEAEEDYVIRMAAENIYDEEEF